MRYGPCNLTLITPVGEYFTSMEGIDTIDAIMESDEEVADDDTMLTLAALAYLKHHRPSSTFAEANTDEF